MCEKPILVHAILPDDYTGSISNWSIKLQEKGLWNGEGWYGDVMITDDQWWVLLEECENEET